MKIHLKPIEEQTLVITGASSGIGLVTARMAAKRGTKLVLAARNEGALEELQNELRANGAEVVFVTADVGREDDVKRIAASAITHFGGFDTWVNNAGISMFSRIDDTPVPDMHRLFDTNFWGVVYGSRVAAEHLKRTGGAIINVGSVFSDRATPVQSIYSASKHAVRGFTDAFRMELEAEGAPISLTLVKPGRIDTPYSEHARSYMPKNPKHRGIIYPPEAVAQAILFCAEHPKRDIFVGSQAKLAAVAGSLMPRLLDKVMEKVMFRTQQGDKPSRPPGDDALYQAGYGLHERAGQIGWMRSGSFYTRASEHPISTSLAAAAAIGLAAGCVAKWRRAAH
jgi:short-subunit dehydrogenase